MYGAVRMPLVLTALRRRRSSISSGSSSSSNSRSCGINRVVVIAVVLGMIMSIYF